MGICIFAGILAFVVLGLEEVRAHVCDRDFQAWPDEKLKQPNAAASQEAIYAFFMRRRILAIQPAPSFIPGSFFLRPGPIEILRRI
jgi:hypothetical protein